MSDSKPRSIIKRIYVPTQTYDLPNGERLKVPGHYREPVKEDAYD